MSKPAAGTYFIRNRVLAPGGQELAITFNGSGQPLSVTYFASYTTQKWVISDFDANTQIISPASDTSLQVAWGDFDPVPLSGGIFTWTISSIQDGNSTVFWGLQDATIDEGISIGAGISGDDGQRWVLSGA